MDSILSREASSLTHLEPPHTNDFCQHATKLIGLCQTSDFQAAESLRFSCD